DPRIGLIEAQAADSLSDYRREQDAAYTAGQQAQARGSRLLDASADIYKGQAAWALGNPNGAIESYEHSRARVRETGARAGGARAVTAHATVKYRQGQFVVAKGMFEESLAIYESLGNERGVGNQLNNLGNVASAQGRIEDAIQLHEAAILHF